MWFFIKIAFSLCLPSLFRKYEYHFMNPFFIEYSFYWRQSLSARQYKKNPCTSIEFHQMQQKRTAYKLYLKPEHDQPIRIYFGKLCHCANWIHFNSFAEKKIRTVHAFNLACISICYCLFAQSIYMYWKSVVCVTVARCI